MNAAKLMMVVGIATCSQFTLAQVPVAWVPPTTLIRVGPEQMPGESRGATLYAARGETQSFQVAVHAKDGNLTSLNFFVTDLHRINQDVNENVGHVIPQTQLTRYREKYMTVLRHSPTKYGPPNLPITNTNTFPDALIPFIDPATGRPPNTAHYVATPVNLESGQNVVFWVDVTIPRDAEPGDYAGAYLVTSKEGDAVGIVRVHVWPFTLPKSPFLKSSFNSGGKPAQGLSEELLRNKLMPATVNPAKERELMRRYGLSATALDFWSEVSYDHCNALPPPSVAEVEAAKATHQPGLYLYDLTADPESNCSGSAFYKAMIAWGQTLHRADVNNFVTQEPVPQLYDDGLGKGRSVVDIWGLLPLAYVDAQSHTPPRVTYVLKKGDAVWSYNALVQDSYSPKWQLDFPPIDYRIQPGFISQSLGLTGIQYWSVDDWSADPWRNPQGGQFPDYPGDGVLIYPGGPAGLQGVAPSMRLKYLRDGVQDYAYIQILKNCGLGKWALKESVKIGRDWHHWTRSPALLESVRIKLGNRIAASRCSGQEP